MKLTSVIIAALVLMGAGYFAPWAAHPAAGLNLSPDDLGEWIKFLPVYRTGQSGLIRELFYAPIWLTALGCGLLAARLHSRGLKLAWLGLGTLLVFTPLPKYPELLSAYREPEFVATFWITAGTFAALWLAGLCGARWLHRLGAILWILLGLGAMLIAPLHFIKVIPDIQRLYAFSIGWGLPGEVVGGLLLICAGVLDWRTQKRGE